MIFFEDLLAAPDFDRSLDGLSPEFRERFALPEIHPLCLLVEDAEKAEIKIEERAFLLFL